MTGSDRIEAHRQSIANFVAAAEAVPEGAWESPLEEGKWSPAQVAEHLRLSYAVILGELEGGPGFRVRVAWWLRPLIRLKYLPQILRQGQFSAEARSPREARPGPGPFPRGQLLLAFREAAEAAEARLGRSSRAKITHHIFGQLGSADALRLLAVHNAHHTAQISAREYARG